MAINDQNYPGFLNPFGSDEEEDDEMETVEGRKLNANNNQKLPERKQSIINKKQDDYPEYLSPFGEDEDGPQNLGASVEDYDNSLNPFGDEETLEEGEEGVKLKNNAVASIQSNNDSLEPRGAGNPFEEEEQQQQQQKNEQHQHEEDRIEDKNVDAEKSVQNDDIGNEDELQTKIPKVFIKSTSVNSLTTKSKASPQPDSLEQPPVPLPRTKSLLKKEQAQRNRQLQAIITDSNQNSTTNSILSTTSSTSSSSLTTNTTSTTTTSGVSTTSGSFQRRNHKRNAPPVPINFKRQVSGSLDAIECELNEIGDNLAIIEKESNQCQLELKATFQVDERKFTKTRSKFEELIRRKNSIVRRQKELMYRKRELKLDQIHSDIEYELRMIGNKQRK